MCFINYPSLPFFIFVFTFVSIFPSFYCLYASFSSFELSSFPLSPTLLFSHIFSPFVHPLFLSLPIFHSLKFIISSQLFKPTKNFSISFRDPPYTYIYSPPNFFHLDTLFIIVLPSPFIFTTSLLSSSIPLRYFHARRILLVRPSISSSFTTLHSCLANTLLVARCDSSPVVVLSARRSAQVAACRQASLVSMTEGEMYRMARVPRPLFNPFITV